jgi:hypothetical protein
MSRNLEQQLEARFADRSLYLGGERYFDLATAPTYVEACDESDLAIIGIEGFEIQNETVTPKMDLIADFSTLVTATTWLRLREQATRAAKEFLSQIRDRQIYVNFTLLSRSEWEQRG